MGVMIGTGAVEGLWKEEYYKPAQEAKQKVPETTDSKPPRKKHFTIRYWITKDSTEEEDNELTSYVNGKSKKLKETDTTFNPIDWWIGKKTTYPTLYQYALDTLSCPAMSTECERVFNSAKSCLHPRGISLRRTLSRHASWWKKELIQQQKDSGGSELCGSEVDSFNSRVSSKVIGNGNGNGNGNA